MVFWDICNFRSCSVTADGIIDNNKVIDMKILKKVFLSGLACLSLIVPLSAGAEGKLNDADLPRVVDEADLLSDSESRCRRRTCCYRTYGDD